MRYPLAIALLLSVLFTTRIFTQSNLTHSDPTLDYQKAIKYLENKEYSHAYAYFERVLSQPNQVTASRQNLYKDDARYYLAYLGAKLGLIGSEEKLVDYYENSQGARKVQLAYHLAEYYFDQEKYSEAESWYDKVTEGLLSKDWLESYYFKAGYTTMERGKLDKAAHFFEKSIKQGKGKYYQDAMYYLGVIYFNQKDYAKSEKYLQNTNSQSSGKDVNIVLAQIEFFKKNYNEVIRLLNADPHQSAGKNGLLGKSYFELKKYEEAVQFLSKHIAENPKVNAEDMYQLAFSEYKTGSIPQAIEHFKELQLSNNFGQYSMYALADCYLKNKDKQNALNAFIQASQGNQDKVITEESKFNVAKLNYDLKNYNEVIKGMTEFLNSYPNSSHVSEAWTLVTSSLLFSNNYPQAITLIEKNEKLQEGNERLYQEICFTYALQLYNSGDKDGAMKYLKKSISNPFDKPLEAEARYLKAEMLFREGNVQAAMVEYNEVYKILTKEKVLFAQNATLFNTHYALGYCEYINKNYSAALMQFQNSVKNYKFNQNEPKSAIMQDLDLRIADIYFIQKNYTAAYDQYSKISQIRGKGYDYATLQKANIDGVRKNYKDKITTLTKLLKEVPNSIYFNDAKYQLGLAYEDNKNYEEAVVIYNELIDKSNSQEYIPKSLVRLATMYYNRNNVGDALKNYSRIASEYSNSSEADQALKSIKEIYISQGRAEEYIDFMNKLPNGKQIQASEQDSILFEAADELYSNGDCEKTIVLLNKYLEKFGNGLFQAKAHFYKAECYSKSKMYAEAIDEYSYLIKENNNPYYERALVKSAYFSYNIEKDYSKAKTLYQKLQAIASTMQNKQVSKIGLLESNYNLKNYAEVIEIAKLIESEPDISNEIKADAIFYRAKSAYFLKGYGQATPLLEAIVKDKSNSRSPECAFYLASIHHNQGNFKKSNEILLQAKDDYGSYENWVVRYFILIGYNYHKLGDNFQAKATLESIVNNYTGDAELVTEAKEKLLLIEAKIKETSKVKYK